METLRKYYKITAKQEYEKNPKLSEADVQELVKWSNENLNLHGKLIDLQIIMFLHACDYDKEYTKTVIRQCYTLKANKCDCFFSARDPMYSFNQKQLDIINVNIIPNKVTTDFSYIWINLKNYDSSIYYPVIAIKLLFMVIDLDQTEYGTKSGYKLILDANNYSISHTLRLSLAHTKHLMSYVQEATSFKIDKIYILNVTAGVNGILSMVKRFMSSSLKNKLTIYSSSNTKEFVRNLPQNVVPKDYGGLAPYCNETNEILKKKLLDNCDYFLEEEKLRNGRVKDEKEMTSNTKKKNDILSFNQLSID